MYHDPDAVPAESRHPFATDLGVSLEGDELITGGLHSPGRYAIARQPGGARNGVLTAVEDFLRDRAADGWQAVIVPIAYGLAVLYRPDSLPTSCRAVVDELSTASKTFEGFLASCEANFLSLYLYAEAAKSQLAYWTGDGQPGQTAYEELSASHRKLDYAYQDLSASRQKLDGAYQDLSAHSEKLLQDYHRLLEAYHTLERSVRGDETAG